jgi:hypothetical protein
LHGRFLIFFNYRDKKQVYKGKKNSGAISTCCGAENDRISAAYVSKAGEVILNDSLQTLTCYMPLSDKVKTLF